MGRRARTLILAEYGADPTTVITAVLHDLPDVRTRNAAAGLTDDTALRTTFGDAMVDLLSEVTALDRSGQMPSFDTTDQRALAIKVADRMQNMRTIRHLRPEKQ